MLNHNKLCWGGVCLVVILAGTAIASPPRPPFDYSICSQSGSYCASVSASEWKINVFQRDTGQGITKPPYAIPGWYPETYLSNDGEVFIAIADFIPKEFLETRPAIRVWLKGALNKTLYLRQILDLNIHKPIITTDGYWWYLKVIGFEGSNRLAVQLVGDRTKPFDGPKYVIELD